MIVHTIISWDCCFRNFHHLIGALADQVFPRDQYEVIFVEQRSRAESDAFNHRLGLKSLQDTVNEYSDRCNVRALFLNHDVEQPYHLGIANNTAIRLARGRYISVMDGDMLVRPSFLSALQKAHEARPAVINLDRRTSSKPVGVSGRDWVKGQIDFDRCLAVCPDRDHAIPTRVSNKGPMVSAPRQWWEAVGGYDEHALWSTGVSKLGGDVNARLEIYAGQEASVLSDEFAVHPYHPAGFSRQAKVQSLVLGIQQQLWDWSVRHQEPSHVKRQPLANELYKQYRWVFKANQAGKSVTARQVFRGAISLASKPFSGVLKRSAA